MTPAHQAIIDKILQQTHNNIVRQMKTLSYTVASPATKPEELRTTPLGQHLTAIATYAEGYPYPFSGNVRGSASEVIVALFACNGKILFPPKYHATPVGMLINEALTHFYKTERPGQLLTVAEVGRRFNVRRQTVHGWIEGGLLFAVYIDGAANFYNKDVENFATTRAQKGADVESAT